MVLAVLPSLAGSPSSVERERDLRLAREGSLDELGHYLETLRPQLLRVVHRGFPVLGDESEDVVQTAAARLLENDAWAHALVATPPGRERSDGWRSRVMSFHANSMDRRTGCRSRTG